MKKKYIPTIAVGVFVLFLACAISPIVHKVRTRQIYNAIATAGEQYQSKSPSIESASEFSKKLHSIKTGYAPAEVKQAVSDYIIAWDSCLVVQRAGRDAKVYNQAVEENKLKLGAVLNANQ